MTSDLQPTRGYSWEQFKDGNTAALKHGATSNRVVAPVARRIVEQTLSDPGLAYLAEPRYSAALEAWARAEARVRVLTTWLEQRATDGVGDYQANRGAFDELHRAETRAASERRELGLTPLARARLGRDIAVASRPDLAVLMADVDADDDEQDGGTEDDRDADEG